MVEALSPASHKYVELYIRAPRFTMGSEAVQELGRVLGSRLTYLELRACQLAKEFWPVVWGHLAGLQQLIVWERVAGDTCTEDVASFCSHATHPLQLHLESELYKRLEAGSGRFEEQCRVGGVPQVTVTEWKRNP
jgi:hypothetical protein